MTFISALIIVVCLAVGSYFQFFSKEIDSPVEQVIEKILAEEKINIDFSADKKNKNANEKKD